MKVKSLLFVVLAAISFVSCNAIKDATSIKITTSLGVKVPVISNDGVSVTLKSAALSPEQTYAFSGETEFSLSDNPDISSHISSITGIELNDGSISFPGFSPGNVINSLTIDIKNEAGNLVLTRTFENITEGSYALSNADILALGAFAIQLETTPDEKFKFILSGNANYPVNGSIALDYGAIVKASVLSI